MQTVFAIGESYRAPALFVLFLPPIRTGDNFDRRPLFAIFDEKPRPRLSLKYELKPRRNALNFEQVERGHFWTG